jgi:hypothetical protein
MSVSVTKIFIIDKNFIMIVSDRSTASLITCLIQIYTVRFKITALLILMLITGLFLPSFTYAQPQSNQSALGTIISNTLNGLSTTLQHLKKGTRAYIALNNSVTLLEKAQKLYNDGNYTGAEYYFKLAMNFSYKGISEAGGKPFSIPPGLNVSRKMALDYAQNLETLAQNVQNETLRHEMLSVISQALSLLNQQALNTTQAAHNIAQARELLGNATAMLHAYSKSNFGKHFAIFIMHHGKFNDNRFIVGISSMFSQMNFSYIESITSAMYFINFTPVMITGTIGVYNKTVYFNCSFIIPYIIIGNETFIPKEIMFPQVHEHLGKSHRSLSNQLNSKVIGMINSSYAESYIVSHKGENITVEILPFVWAPQSLNRLHFKVQTNNVNLSLTSLRFLNMTVFFNGSSWIADKLNSHIKVPLIIIIFKDVGYYSSVPQGIQVLYENLSN